MNTPTCEFDLRGQICPSTLLTALREINLRQSELKKRRVVLVFLTDNRHATVTVPQAVINMGLHCEVVKTDNTYQITVEGNND